MAALRSQAGAIVCLVALFAASAHAYYTGDGTAYSAAGHKDDTGFNACGFGKLDSRWETYYAALPSNTFGGGSACGRCIRARGTESGAPGDWVTVMVVDECASCSGGDVDFSSPGLEAVTGYSWDRKGIEWEWTDCNGGGSSSSSSSSSSSRSSDSSSNDNSNSNNDSSSNNSGDSLNTGDVGTYTSYQLDCKGKRKHCPNKTLASMGYQCTNKDESKCCSHANGKDCKPVDSVDDQGWDGKKRRRTNRRLASTA